MMRLQLRAMDVGLACLSALLLCLLFPKFDLGSLAWFALVPLLLALEGKGFMETLILCFLAGFLSCVGIFSGVAYPPAVTIFGFSLLGAYLALYLTFWGLGLYWIRRRTSWPLALVAPPLWVTLEYCRAHFFFLSLPLSQLGHSQYTVIPLIQITSITGAYGLSFLIVCINAIIAQSLVCLFVSNASLSFLDKLKAFPHSLLVSGTIGVCLLTGTLGFGFFVLANEGGYEQVRVGLVQGNIPRSKQWDPRYRQDNFVKHTELTRQALTDHPQLIVWPESAVPVDVEQNDYSRKSVASFAKEIGRFILVGSSVRAKFGNNDQVSPATFEDFQGEVFKAQVFNSMVLFSPEGDITGAYRKIGLVPFAEYTPLKEYVGWPKSLVPATGNTLPGKEFTMFNIGTSTFGVLICWEVQFPELFRELVTRGAEFIVNANNEIYFGDSPITYQYLALSAILAAQHQRSIGRVGNTGVTAFIDPFGRITHRLRGSGQKELFVEGVLVEDVPVTSEMTFYTRYGEVFAFTQIALCTFFIFFAGFKRWFFLFSGRRAKVLESSPK